MASVGSDYPQIIVPRFRAYGVWVDEPAAPMKGSDKGPQYMCGMLIPKKEFADQTGEYYKVIVKTTAGLIKSAFPNLNPAGIRKPWRDGDTDTELVGGKHPEIFAGHYFMRAKSKNQPDVIHAKNRKPLMPPDELYSGCYAMAACALGAYEYMGKKGVTIYLNSLVKLADGEKLAGRPSAEDQFADVDFSKYGVDGSGDVDFDDSEGEGLL